MRSRSRSGFMVVAMALLSILVVSAGLAWACTPAEGGVDDDGGSPGEQTTFHGRYFKAHEPVDVRWNKANQNSPDAPLMTTAKADPNGLLTFTVTIPDAAPGSYWIVVNGPSDNWAEGGTRFRAAAEYTIEGAPPAEEPSQAPPSQEPQQSNEPRSDRPSDRSDARKIDRPAGGSPGSTGVATPQGDTAALAASPSSDEATAERGRDQLQDQEVSVAAYRHDPAMATVPAWSASSPASGGDPAPTLVPAANAKEPVSPLSHLVLGVTILGAGLVLMFAGFFVADVRRQRKAEVEVEAESNHLRS